MLAGVSVEEMVEMALKRGVNHVVWFAGVFFIAIPDQ
jgi:hypothetical protein